MKASLQLDMTHPASQGLWSPFSLIASHSRPRQATAQPGTGGHTELLILIAWAWEAASLLCASWLFRNEKVCQSPHLWLQNLIVQRRPVECARGLPSHLGCLGGCSFSPSAQRDWPLPDHFPTTSQAPQRWPFPLKHCLTSVWYCKHWWPDKLVNVFCMNWLKLTAEKKPR